ncbi:CDP-glycerol glycerophosphotransferase (TagB/SpsB family) [Natranaerovirga pectinivora]|uniref:CDP-glycerol glycerophosphotransferase (TagB/SpsB family) n=1 Tax=Natranaerovirga pectinivora TaxID=682400 RepID=A0A4R3MN45_9FIRM|nr:CDP-glycerol glycerophosphotransferase family protein [Natranaerovirga pectinivora]TCT14032.1 CDP-glycerol glycerophosphotransferase (TagB/SpsB family) [Natranaerovirga pectinivora]
MNKIVLFGASRLGEIAYQYLTKNHKIIAYVDNDETKLGKTMNNVKIYNTEILSHIEGYIIICSMYDLEIVTQLIGLGVTRFGVFEVNQSNYEVMHYDYSDIDDFSVKPNKICLIIENNSGSNTYALLKRVDEIICEKYNVTSIYKYLKNSNYYFDILTSKLILYTHDTRCNENQINIQMWHGFPLKGLSYMSKYNHQNREANHIAWSRLDYIVSYSQTYSTLMNACYGVDGEKYKVLGMPRNDLLFCTNSKKRLEEVYNITLNNKKVIFYIPTFRNTVFGEKNGGFIKSCLTDDELIELNTYLEENNTIMVYKMHPQEEKELITLKNILNLTESMLVDFSLDLYELLGSADVLITDYSSVYFDFLLLDKPIIFYIFDYKTYEASRGFLLHPFDFWAPGAKAYDFKSLLIAINNGLYGDEYKLKRDLICNIVHTYKDNQSCDRVWSFVDEILNKNNFMIRK